MIILLLLRKATVHLGTIKRAKKNWIIIKLNVEKDIMLISGDKNCRRERLRIRYLATVYVTIAHGDVIRGNLRDISIDGMFVKVEKILQTFPKPEDLIEVALSVVQGKSKLTISISGKIARCDADGFAITFAEKLKWWPVFSLFPINDQFLFDVVAEI